MDREMELISPILSNLSPSAQLTSTLHLKRSCTTTSSPPLTICSTSTRRKPPFPPSAEREKIEREIAVMDEKIDGIV